MTWSQVLFPLTWNVTDVELLKLLQYMLLEALPNSDATGTSPNLTPMFGFQEFLDALNNRQYQFLRDTGCVISGATMSGTPGQGRYALPTDWIDSRRMTWTPVEPSVNNFSFHCLNHVTTVVVDTVGALQSGHTVTVTGSSFTTGPPTTFDGTYGPIVVINSTTYTYPDPTRNDGAVFDVATFPASTPGISTSIDTQLAAGISSLPRVDTWGLDNSLQTWQSDVGTPQVYSDTALPNQTMEITPPPSDVGTLGLVYVPNSPTLDGTGIKLIVPDEFADGILFGALADLLSSDGEALDVQRSQYCEQRYSLSVELCKLLLRGRSA